MTDLPLPENPVVSSIVEALKARGLELSALAEEQMRPSLEERAQEWFEAASVAKKTAQTNTPVDKAAVLDEAAEKILATDLGPRLPETRSQDFKDGWASSTLRAQSFLLAERDKARQ